MKSEEPSGTLDKANRPKPPKPPLPPKPVGYIPPARQTNENASRGDASTGDLENHVPNIVVSNVEEGQHGLNLDNNNNSGVVQTQRVNDSSRSLEQSLNGETTPKTIAPSEIADKTTTAAVESQMRHSKLVPKAIMAREESMESVDNEVCCTNLASYFVHRAKSFVHPPENKNKKVPPPKPPKPKPEDIERARKRLSSFGEEIPGGKAGFRYVDDESTESSVDYKDVVFENGRILAVNRLPKPPKSDSPEPEPVVKENDYEPLELYQKTPVIEDSVFDDHSESTINPLTYSLRSASSTDIVFNDISKCEDVFLDTFQSLPPSDNQLDKLKSDEEILNSVPKLPTPDDSVFEDYPKSENEPKVEILANCTNEIPSPCDPANDNISQPSHQLVVKQSSQNYDYAVPKKCTAAIKKTPLEERHSWPARGKKGAKNGKVPPGRPPPPRRKCMSLPDEEPEVIPKNVPESLSENKEIPSSPKEVIPKNVSDSPSETKQIHCSPKEVIPKTVSTSQSDNEQIIGSPKVKPPRPPPPKSPVLLRRSATTESVNKKDPRAPPRQRRSRSRTLEITPESLKGVPESSNFVRRAASFTGGSNVKRDEIAMYSSTTDNSHDRHSYDKMKFRPLPPPPPPPRTHSKKPDKLPDSISSRDVCSAQDKSCVEKKSPSACVISPGKTDKTKKESPKIKKVKPERPSNPKKNSLKRNASPIIDKTVLADENANLPAPSHCSTDKPDIVTRCNSGADKAKNQPKRYSASTFYCDNLSSEDPNASKSKTPSPVVMRSRASFSKREEDGAESEVSGINADIDSSVNSSRQASVDRSLSKSKKGDRSSVFYYELAADSKQCMEKSVQTSPDFSSCPVTDKGEDSDELMDIANDIRRELNSILERRRNAETTDSDHPSSQEDLPISMIRRNDHGSSRSSEVSWQESSEESDLEVDGGPAVLMSPEEKKERKIFFIANELMTSEATFVDALRLLNVDFQNAVNKSSSERGSPVVPDEVMNHIYRYLPQLQNLNENLLQEIRHRTEHWAEKKKISDVIVKIGPFLKLYSSYIREFESVTVTLDEACRKYPPFAQLVKDFEARPACQKLQLKHFLLKPVQRIPQYRLLLEDYLRHLMPGSVDYDDTIRALQIVSEVANHANETMKQGDNFLKLVSIQNSLLTHHEIVKPGRAFLKEGELMKLSRRVMQSRWFILFNDSLLYLTPVQQGLYRINHELPLTGMRVSVPMQTDYRNEFSVISVTRSFSLAARTAQERDEWITDLTRAIEENAVKRSSFVNVQMQQQGKAAFHIADTALGKQAPVWIPDVRVTMCQLCTTEFTITYRRHHCRACGRVICWACSANRARLHYLDQRFARVCDACYTKLNEDLEYGNQSPSTDLRTTDSEAEARPTSKGIKPFSSGQHKQPGKKKLLPNVLKERGKREARLSPTATLRVRANDQGSDISGHLFMQSRRTWKRFWFVLKDKVLYTYKASEDVAAKKSLPLLGFTVEVSQTLHEGIDPSLVFTLKHPGQPNIWFYAESVGFAERWVRAMKSATVL